MRISGQEQGSAFPTFPRGSPIWACPPPASSLTPAPLPRPSGDQLTTPGGSSLASRYWAIGGWGWSTASGPQRHKHPKNRIAAPPSHRCLNCKSVSLSCPSSSWSSPCPQLQHPLVDDRVGDSSAGVTAPRRPSWDPEGKRPLLTPYTALLLPPPSTAPRHPPLSAQPAQDRPFDGLL